MPPLYCSLVNVPDAMAPSQAQCRPLSEKKSASLHKLFGANAEDTIPTHILHAAEYFAAHKGEEGCLAAIEDISSIHCHKDEVHKLLATFFCWLHDGSGKI